MSVVFGKLRCKHPISHPQLFFIRLFDIATKSQS